MRLAALALLFVAHGRAFAQSAPAPAVGSDRSIASIPAVSSAELTALPDAASQPLPASPMRPSAPIPSVPETGAAASAPPTASVPALELLFHADLDGRLATPACVGTSAHRAAPTYAALIGRLTALRDAAGADQSAPVALMGGNIAAPDLFGASLLERGPSGIEALAGILAQGRYDAIALGHHELSLDKVALGQLVAALKAAGMTVVATNLRCDGHARGICPQVQPDVLTKRGTLSVGVVATISPAVLLGIPAGVWRGLTLDDPATAARAAIRGLRKRGARVVVLMAQGPRDTTALDRVDALSRQLAAAPVEERPDVILAGGLAGDLGDLPVRTLRRDGASPIAGSPTGSDGLTRIRLASAPDPASPASETLVIDTVPSAGATPDPATSARLQAELGAVCAAYGTAAAPAPIRDELTREAFTTYVLEVMRHRAGSEIALVNRGFVKSAPFPLRGRLTRAELYRAMPFRAVVGVATVAGATVDSALGPTIGKDQLSMVGLARGTGGLEVNGRPLDKARAYTLTTIQFIANGGDGALPAGALHWHPLPGEPDVREMVEDFLAHHTADRDGDPTIDPRTDFGRPVAQRPLVVALGDLGLDLSSTSIANAPAYTDSQLVRASQLAITGNATGLLQVRDRVHEADVRLDLKYGWSRNQPVGSPLTSGETADLITFSGVYNFRGLRGSELVLKRAVPDPFVRVRLESEFTRPEVTPTQTRTYHHAQMTNTAGVLFTVLPKLRLRAGAGAQSELLASGTDGAWQPVLEAGGTLDPVAIATFGSLAVKLEGLVDYDFVDPTGLRQHEVRGTGKLSVPLLPALFITVGIDVFAVQRERQGWATSADVVAGIRVHYDLAYQGL